MFGIGKQGVECRTIGERCLLRHGSIAALLTVMPVGFVGIGIEGDEHGSRSLCTRDTFECRVLDGNGCKPSRHKAAALFR